MTSCQTQDLVEIVIDKIIEFYGVLLMIDANRHTFASFIDAICNSLHRLNNGQ